MSDENWEYIFSTTVAFVEILISFNDVQPQNNSKSMYWMPGGIEILVKDLQSQKTESLKRDKLEGSSMPDNDEHPSNAFDSILVTLVGMLISFKLVQL